MFIVRIRDRTTDEELPDEHLYILVKNSQSTFFSGSCRALTLRRTHLLPLAMAAHVGGVAFAVLARGRRPGQDQEHHGGRQRRHARQGHARGPPEWSAVAGDDSGEGLPHRPAARQLLQRGEQVEQALSCGCVGEYSAGSVVPD